jgi:hypothetical protein
VYDLEARLLLGILKSREVFKSQVDSSSFRSPTTRIRGPFMAPGKRFSKAALHLLLAGVFPLAGCIQTPLDIRGDKVWVTLDLQGFEPLDGGLLYQAWAIQELGGTHYVGEPFLLFNVDRSGHLLDPVDSTTIRGPVLGPLPKEELFGIAISIEFTQGEFVASSFSYLVGGKVEKGVAELELGHWTGMASDLSGMSGSFLLATLTDPDRAGEAAGVWFLDSSGSVPTPGLNLPDAQDGWDYEGWVVVGTDTLSTGKFSFAGGPDEGDRYCGGDPGPAFPGEDFLLNPPTGLTFPMDLRGAEVFVTLEPWERWDVRPESPFFVRLLQAQIPQFAQPGQAYPMESLLHSLPKGTARVR